ncbi:hypothetical protein SDRG_09682 [Saprolegnia diclina VS20]|uniref:Uncharacterized protein n=1 Tax=Saprolegnia diclina (strain VS20) TaxID=1156394 RepID=T0Q4E8_SAPDV|nr:hypothetical protein SDRG_09682 [Saprolegnia diclina VS20]EQC32709.1 hypothetical protein SDRG_09682 [Saprolegnia diclina VS20]|eukprot:XP_008613853.1 hypothetical protein SDRG_09682 [Saprolegnia diclina VS20]
MQQHRHLFASVTCVFTSVALSAYALVLFTPYMENGLFWPGLVTADTLSLVMTILNYEFTLAAATNATSLAVDLLQPHVGVVNVADRRGINPTAPRFIVYQTLTSIEAGIDGLRRLEAQNVLLMLAPYCWMDFGRRYSFAHTPKRLLRCEAARTANGAAYFEAVLRNIDLPSWLVANEALFFLRLGNGVVEAGGGAWLNTLLSHALLPPADEARVWRTAGLDAFELMYGNRVQIGLTNQIQIVNALGVNFPFYAASIAATNRGASWTSSNLYQSLHLDWSALRSNESLILGSANWYGNVSASALEAYAVGLPLTRINQVIHDRVGPLANIDMRWVPVPSELLTAVDHVHGLVVTALRSRNASIARAYASIVPLTMSVVPSKWQDPGYLFLIGSLMCQYGVPVNFVQRTFGFDDSCGTALPFSVTTHPIKLVFALRIWLQTMSDQSSLGAICAQVPSDERRCNRLLTNTTRLLSALPSWDVPPSLVRTIMALNTTKPQFLTRPNRTEVELETIAHFGEGYELFAWMVMYDWAIGLREIVTFEGDTSTLRVSSYAYTPLTNPTSPLQSSVGTYLISASWIVTVVLALVAMLSLGTTYGYLFARIASAVWLNRSVLFLRSLTASVCLATSPIVASIVGPMQQLEAPPRSLLTSMVLSSESLWTTYVAHDILSPLLHSSYYVHLNTVLAWVVLTAIDVWYPVSMTVAIEMNCSTVNMDWQVYCAAASIAIGSTARVGFMYAVQGLMLLLTVGVSAVVSKRCLAVDTKSSLLLHTSVLAFLPPAISRPVTSLDHGTRIMAGLLPLGSTTFHLSLWHHVPLWPSSEPEVCVVGPFDDDVLSLEVAVTSWRDRSRFQMAFLFLGFCYVLATLTSNVLYYSVVANNLSNDYGWAGFNSSGAQAFVANVFNRQLMLTTQEPAFALDSPGHGDMSQLYNTSTTVILWAESSARRQLYSDASLDVAVANLRRMHPCQLPWMFTQYCWLDLSQTWEMAATASRQARCARSMASNGAVYLEIGLRNLNNWTTWDTCWGDSWQLGFVKYLETSRDGQQWLESISSATLSIEDEVRLWESHAISTFQLQWQNYKTPGMDDSIWIQSALGMTYPLQLSQSVGSVHTSQQTSFKMYWSLASDLWAITTNTSGIGGASLLRSSSLFAFVNVSTTSVLVQNATLQMPLSAGFSLLASTIGPFGAIDLVYVSPPPRLLSYVSSVVSYLTQLLVTNLDAQHAFRALSVPVRYAPVPTLVLALANTSFVGGNILCGDDSTPWSVQNGFFVAFSGTNMCHASFTDMVQPTPLMPLLALLAMTASSRDIDSICALDMLLPATCSRDHTNTLFFLKTYVTTYNATLTDAVVADVLATGVGLVQFLVTSGVTSLRHFALLDPNDRAYMYYGWCYLFKWALGDREAISLTGDHGQMTVLSGLSLPLAMVPDSNAVPLSFALLTQYCVQYITIVLIGISSLLVISASYHGGRMEGLNLLCVNRIVGMVWLGRPFVFLRSLSAIWLLNTSPLTLVQAGVGTYFTAPPLAWFNTLLATSEVTWFVYVLNDLFSCASQQYTSLYASKSSNLTWLVIFLWTLQSPQLYAAAVHRRCVYDDMDAGVHCVSGGIAVGSLRRVGTSIGLVLACLGVTYLFMRWYAPIPRLLYTPTPLLNAQSYYMLRLQRWHIDGVQYIDKTSAIMAGLLCTTYRGQHIVLDIKSWRIFATPLTTAQAEHGRLRHALPLHP